jgi:hypothetical protein
MDERPPLVIRFSPHTTANLSTSISFSTSHALPGSRDVLLEKQADFPSVPTNEHTMKLIQPLLDLVIVHQDSIWFLRPVDPVIDHAENYNRIIERPMDLGLMRKKCLTGSYTTFDQLVADMDLLIKNAMLYNPISHCVHQACLKLSYFFRDQLLRIEANPGINPFESASTTAAENRIAGAISNFQRAKKDAAKAEKATQDASRTKVPQRQAKKITEAEMESLVMDIKKLKSPALIGVLEIIAKKPFKIDLLPLEVDLSIAEESVIERLKTYVDCCKESNAQFYYAWKPQLPDDLQEVRDKYEADLLDWLKPPAEQAP